MTGLGQPKQVQAADSLPGVKWLSQGDVFVGRLVDALWDRDRTDANGKLLLNDSGNPKQQHILTLHVVQGTTAKVGDKMTKRDAVVGELVSLWVDGLSLYDSTNPLCCSDTLKGHGEPSIGDVMKVVFAEQRDTGKQQPQKIRQFYMRKAKTDGSESAAVQAAQAAHDERHKPTPLGQPAQPLAVQTAPSAPNLSDF